MTTPVYLLKCLSHQLTSLRRRLVPVTALAVFLVACSSQSGEQVQVSESTASDVLRSDCQPFANTRPLCGFQRPEDLAVLPGEQALIVSEYGDTSGAKPGSLSLLLLGSFERVPLFNGGEGRIASAGWGDPQCTQPPGPLFSPHGIDLRQRSDGALQLLVVQHGGRESIEFFEVTGEGQQWSAQWRGCVIAPADAQLNSVASDDTGAFYTTKMLHAAGEVEGMQEFPTGPTGFVYRWSASEGFTEVEGSAGGMPNGIVASNDGATLYVNYSAGAVVRKIDRVSGKLLAEAAVPAPDNIKWSADGKTLLVASLQTEMGDFESFTHCMAMDQGFCPIPFAIVELDPQDMSSSELFSNPDAPMGGGTVGMKVNGDLYIGSFAGDRILRVILD